MIGRTPIRRSPVGRTTHSPTVADPSRDIRFGVVIAATFFVLFLGWAAFARLDAAAYASGTLVVSGQHQSVQHRNGGVVGEIFVKDGQRVMRGQILLRLAAAEIKAEERTLASQSIRLMAQRARLEAEQLGHTRLRIPSDFNALSGADQAEAATAMRLQQVELAARSAVLAAQLGVLGQQAMQSGEQVRGFHQQAASTREQLKILDEQIAALRPVAEKGFVSQTRMRELERLRAQLEGERGQFSASVAQTQGAVRENAIKALEAERTFRERTESDLREVENNLGVVLPKWTAARDQLARATIRSPATGAVVGLTVFTPGGVVAAGQKLMDIIPDAAPLLIQAHVAPDDADDLVVGQRTLVKFPGLHERALPSLEGRLTGLSADSLTDERGGSSYFIGEVTVPRSQLKLIQDVRGPGFKLRAGMPVQILIPLHKRSALDYALEPLLGSFWSSFREH